MAAVAPSPRAGCPRGYRAGDGSARPRGYRDGHAASLPWPRRLGQQGPSVPGRVHLRPPPLGPRRAGRAGLRPRPQLLAARVPAGRTVPDDAAERLHHGGHQRHRQPHPDPGRPDALPPPDCTDAGAWLLADDRHRGGAAPRLPPEGRLRHLQRLRGPAVGELRGPDGGASSPTPAGFRWTPATASSTVSSG